jgi:hypothetical protein
MTTDLTGGSDLGEEEFDWDVFAPDPDETELAAAAAALENQAELNLDDSDLDWDAALQEPEPMGGADGEARAGAAFDRIVDTVRRFVEDPEAETEEADEIVAAQQPEATQVTGPAWPDLDEELDLDDEPNPDDVLEPDAVHEPQSEPVHEVAVAASVAAAFEPRAEPDDPSGQARGHDAAPWVEPVLPDPPDLHHEGAWELRPEPEPNPVATFAPEAASMMAASATPTWTTGLEPEPATAPPSASASVAPEPEASDDAAERTTKTRSTKSGERRRRKRSRVFTATVVLACLFLAVVAGVVAVRSLHHPTAATSSATGPSHSAARVSTSPDAGRMQAATDAVDSATTAAQVGLTSLSDFPTPSNVAKVIYPYLSSLQLYQSFLSSSTVPVPARAAAASAATQVRQELTFLATIAALPPEQLGAYLQQFGTDATRLQTTLSALEIDLRTPAS